MASKGKYSYLQYSTPWHAPRPNEMLGQIRSCFSLSAVLLIVHCTFGNLSSFTVNKITDLTVPVWCLGGLFSYFSGLFGSRERRILILGLDGAGKTTILYRLQVGEVVTTIPSGFCLYWPNCILCHLRLVVTKLLWQIDYLPYGEADFSECWA